MIINTAGDYTLRYTATDECGNSSSVDRAVEVVSLRTVMYADGTLIINEKSSDIEDNIQEHGSMSYLFPALDANNPYVFTSASEQPWALRQTSVKRVEIGSRVRPTSTAYWFSQLANLESADLTLLDTSNVTSMDYMFNSTTRLSVLDVSHFNTSNVTSMAFMFVTCGVESLDVSNFNTSNVTNMRRMFSAMGSIKTLNISSFDTSNVTNMEGMFISMGRNTYEGPLDVSSFNTSNVTDMSNMFRNFTRINTIYASQSFVTTGVTSSDTMFDNSTALVGGAGTAWSSSNPTNKTYARIDNPPDAPGYFTAKE